MKWISRMASNHEVRVRFLQGVPSSIVQRASNSPIRLQRCTASDYKWIQCSDVLPPLVLADSRHLSTKQIVSRFNSERGVYSPRPAGSWPEPPKLGVSVQLRTGRLYSGEAVSCQLGPITQATWVQFPPPQPE